MVRCTVGCYTFETELFYTLGENVHFHTSINCIVGLALDEEAVDYDLDSEDDEWLSVQSHNDQVVMVTTGLCFVQLLAQPTHAISYDNLSHFPPHHFLAAQMFVLAMRRCYRL